MAASSADPKIGRSDAVRVDYAEILGGLLGRPEPVPADAHFFDVLGADSMIMAQFCARVRKRADLPSVSMKDIYRCPSLDQLVDASNAPLATPVAEAAEAAAGPQPSGGGPSWDGISIIAAGPKGTTPLRVIRIRWPGPPRYVLCGVLQATAFLIYVAVYGVIGFYGYDWISAGTDVLSVYLRSVAFGGTAFLAVCLLPILAKWVLIGRWTTAEIPIWSRGYLKFWFVKTLTRLNPLVLLAVGSPIFAWYLRALGARIGRGVVILTRTVPVCTDLITIGDHTVIRKDAHLTGYRAHAGVIQTGPLTLGRRVVIGEKTVLDIDTSLGDDAQLGHSSSLHPGQHVPDGQRWHGSPARPTGVDYRFHGVGVDDTRRRVAFGILQLVGMVLVTLPMIIAGVAILLRWFPPLAALLDPDSATITSSTFWTEALVASVAVFFGGQLLLLGFVLTVPRLLSLAVRPDTTYPLFGFHYSLHRTITLITNSKFFTYLFGDSSYIVNYLTWLGYDLSHAEQTGSNFGTGVAHETPFLATVGRGTMVADGLSIINADYSDTAFRLTRTSIGAHNFLGNHIAYPSQGRTGENCLLATKVMVPMDGPLRENVGLLGSPPFEIPRSVQRDSRLDPVDAADLARRLALKNGHNLRSMALALTVRWFHLFGITVLSMIAAHFLQPLGVIAISTEMLVALLFTVVYFSFVERAGARFRPLSPRFVSIYDPYFWNHERYWKLVIPQFDKLLAGTPFKNVLSRVLGVRIGRRVFDDGCFLPERTLASIGDDCCLNELSIIQCHSQEDGSFKSDHTTLGKGCTLGVGALVHYGVTVGDGVELAADSFLMKGEDVPAGASWGGNPAFDLGAAMRPTRVLPADRPAPSWSAELGPHAVDLAEPSRGTGVPVLVGGPR